MQQGDKNSQFIRSTALIPAAQIVTCCSVRNYSATNMSNASLFFCSVIIFFFLSSSHLKCGLFFSMDTSSSPLD